MKKKTFFYTLIHFLIITKTKTLLILLYSCKQIGPLNKRHKPIIILHIVLFKETFIFLPLLQWPSKKGERSFLFYFFFSQHHIFFQLRIRCPWPLGLFPCFWEKQKKKKQTSSFYTHLGQYIINSFNSILISEHLFHNPYRES